MAERFPRYRRLIDRCRQFCVDSRGMSLPMVALILMPVLGFIGLSVDAGRGYMVKSRLGDALDAAALAGAQVVHDQVKFDHDVDMFFYANFPKGFLGADPVLIKPSVTANTPTITLSATATVNTTFTRFLGYETMSVGSSTEVTRLTSSMDVVIAIDMSGSMAGSKLSSAKDAAKDLVDILFGAESTKDFLQIGLVPWNGKVNVSENGVAFTGSIPQASGLHLANNSPVPLTVAPPADWRGCVYARFTDNGIDDDADDRLGDATVNGAVWDGWEPIGDESEPSSTTACVNDGSGTMFPCTQNGVTRLTDTKANIDNAITQLADPVGATNIASGLAWAWRLLMPGAPFTDGVLVPKGRHTRAIVLLTDGEQQGWYSDAYNGQFGTSKPNDGLKGRLEVISDAVKAQGVEIYTIQYEASTSGLDALMQSVASGPAAPYWYSADNSAQLKEAFQEVANHLSELRLSK